MVYDDNNPISEWPHPDRCPGSDCRGQFFWIKHYGMICTVRLYQIANGRNVVVVAAELSREALIARSEGLGLA